MVCGVVGLVCLLSVVLSPGSIVLGTMAIVLGRRSKKDPSANQSQAAAAIMIGWTCLGLTALAVAMVALLAMLMMGTGIH